MATELIDTFKASIHTALLKPNSQTLTEIENVYQQEQKLDVELKKAYLDQSFRNYLIENLLANPEQADLDECTALITLSIKAARADICSSTVPIALLADVFDVITLAKCEVLFGFVESSVAIWKEAFFFQAIKNNLLRICNDLLRRLSRSQNTVFCGRILLFLAKFFPFSERSGLNVISEFNLENTTVFSSDDFNNEGSASNGELAAAAAAAQMEVDEDEGPEAKKIKIEDDHKDLHIDYALYSKFWQLQDFFRNPVQCYNKDNWKKFSTFSDDVLKTFQSFKLDSVSVKNSASQVESKSGRKEEERFFAKYLTNQNLLQLQMSDSNFRRYIYVQMLILFQYLQSSVKFKQDSFVLNDEQSKWVNSAREQIYKLIKETPPNGAQFAESVKHLLKREEQWNTWKNDGCPALITAGNAAAAASKNGEKSLGVIGGTRKRKAKLGDMIKDATNNGRFLMGNAALTKLWNICPDNLEACASIERDFLPSVEDYFAEAIEQLDPASQVEETYKKVNDGQWGWRALRLLAKKTPHFFTYGNNPIAKLPDYLESMLKRMATGGGLNKSGNSTMDVDVKLENGSDSKAEIKTEPQASDESEASAPAAFVCTPEQLEKLAENLSTVENWKKITPKLGFTDEDIEKMFEEKKVTETKDKILLMLTKWSEVEGPGATNEEIIYILEGAKMIVAIKDVFPEKL